MEEIKDIVWEINSLKASGLDRMPIGKVIIVKISLLQPCAPCWKSDLSQSSCFNSLQIQEFHNSSGECINAK